MVHGELEPDPHLPGDRIGTTVPHIAPPTVAPEAMNIRSLILTVGLTSLLAASSALAGATWKTDLEAAKTEAKRDKKLIVMNFTGSDWCGYCIKMKKDTLDQKAFEDYAAKNVVLVEVDFPMRKAQAAAQKKANKALEAKYKIEGYPTFLVVDGEGKELARHVGYLQGGPDSFIAFVDGARHKQK